jgi:hypothetical protein
MVEESPMSFDYMQFFRKRAAASVGKSESYRLREMQFAMAEYQNAKSVVGPIDRLDLEQFGDPFACPLRQPYCWEGYMLEAADDGRNLDEAFRAIFPPEDYLWRTMKREERLGPGQLIALMDSTSRAKAMELFGTGAVIKAIVRAGMIDTPDEAEADRRAEVAGLELTRGTDLRTVGFISIEDLEILCHLADDRLLAMSGAKERMLGAGAFGALVAPTCSSEQQPDVSGNMGLARRG